MAHTKLIFWGLNKKKRKKPSICACILPQKLKIMILTMPHIFTFEFLELSGEVVLYIQNTEYSLIRTFSRNSKIWPFISVCGKLCLIRQLKLKSKKVIWSKLNYNIVNFHTVSYLKQTKQLKSHSYHVLRKLEFNTHVHFTTISNSDGHKQSKLPFLFSSLFRTTL